MKNLILSATGLMTLVFGGAASSDVVYSNFLNTTIANTYTGTDVYVGDGTLNLFFGGAGVANDSEFQLFRTAAGGLATMQGFAPGDPIGLGSGTLATGSGGSVDHLGSQFTAGTEKYLGFQLDAANYGWMRGTFTYATAGAVIKDWAYDTTGVTIKAGLIQTDVTDPGLTTTTTLNPGASDSFALASDLTNGVAGGYTNSLLKQGDGTVTLKGTNTYTGATDVKAGTLLVNGSTAAGSTVTVGGATASGTPTLGGTGTINGPVVISATTGGIVSTMAPGVAGVNSGVGTQTFSSTLNYGSGSIFEWQLSSNTADGRGTSFDGVDIAFSQLDAEHATTNKNLTIDSGAIFKLVLGGAVSFNPATDTELFWNSSRSWQVFADATANLFSTTGNFTVDALSANYATYYPNGHFSFDNTIGTLNWTAVPEPTSALAALLLGAGLLRRRR